MNNLLSDNFRLKPIQLQSLIRLKLETVNDLFYYFPRRWEEPAKQKKIADLVVGEIAAIHGQVIKTKTSRAFRRKIPLAEMVVEDMTGRLKAIWFHQAYLAKRAKEGEWVRLAGKITKRKDELYLANPSLAKAEEFTVFTPLKSSTLTEYTPIYPETRGLSSAWFAYHLKQLLSRGLHQTIPDPLPQTLLEKYHLPSLASALVFIHEPRNEKDFLAAQKRFAFEEIFFIQLNRLRGKADYQKHESRKIALTWSELEENFISQLPFSLTKAQARATKQILSDLARKEPMMRLLEGDVGSGKTAVAAAAAFATVKNGFEATLMAPTEILSRQHFESFIKNFPLTKIGGRQINIGLLTGHECLKFPSKINPREATKISRTQLLKWLASGEVPILVGTHALIQKTVRFKNLALVIIDEQHRFGVRQRQALIKKEGGSPTAGLAPHLLSLSATPIPRTLALTVYGDLDLTLLDELPPGRQPIITEIVPETERAKAYRKIGEELARGRQGYVICPRIDAPDPSKELALDAKSAKEEARRLASDVFPQAKIGLVHSKLKPKDKEVVMADFAAGEIDLLVATSVVEVGVNVPNATVILIEGAECFGLAQLHQLRGRVWRSEHQAYCFLFSGSSNGTGEATGKALERLKALREAKSGFALAELDLKLRGAGSLTGGKQWGLSDLGMSGLQNLKMVEAARHEAQKLLKIDPELKQHKTIRERLASNVNQSIHFE